MDQPFVKWVSGLFFSRVKWPGRVAVNWPLSNADFASVLVL